MRILIAEDDSILADGLSRSLRYEGYAVDVVNDGSSADSALQVQSFDLLILDINLGEERTGIDLLQELRARDSYKDTPALALTAYAMPGDRERLERSGFTRYISKPFTRKELYDAIDSMLSSDE